MIHEVLHIGDPRLERIAEPVTQFNTPELHTLIGDMFDTMRAAQGVGLAAPQIAVNCRVIVYGFTRNERYPDEAGVADTVLINPELIFCDTMQVIGLEGCLSVPGKRGQVPRYTCLKYRAQDVLGNWFERKVSGFHARIVQHEVDHLNGILYPSVSGADLFMAAFTNQRN